MIVDEHEMTLGQRLHNLRIDQKNRNRGSKQWTMQYVAQKLGITSGAVSQYETDRNKPSPDVLLRYAKLFNVTVDDLLSEDSSDLKLQSKPNPGSLISGKKAQLFLSQLPEKDAEQYIPYYDVEITAGKIELYFDDVEEIPEGYVYAPQYQGCVMCNVKGNSMYDLIYPGARLYVYQMADKKYIDFGQIYLIVLPSMRVLKYIRRHPTDDNKIVLASHNKEHDSWDVDKVDIINLFMVKGFENQIAM